MGWDRADTPAAPTGYVYSPRNARSFETLAEGFRRGLAAESPESGLSASLTDYRRSLVYACTTLRADMLAGLPLRLYRWTDDDEVEGRALDLRQPIMRAGKPRHVGGIGLTARRSLVEVEGAPLIAMLSRPNEDWSMRAMLRQIETALCLVGQAHLHLHRTSPEGGSGKLTGFSFVKHSRIDVVKAGAEDAARTIAGWTLDRGKRSQKSLVSADVAWLRYVDPDDPDYGCLAPAQVAALGSEAYGQAMRSNLDIFRKGLRAGAIITPPEESSTLGWDQVDEMQADVDRQLRSARNNHNVAVMPYRFGIERLDITPHDAEFVALLEFAIEDVARAFKVPIEMVGGTRRTYQNAEAADRALWARCLEPEAAWIAEELTASFIPAAGLGPEYVLGFDLCDVTALQDDETLRWTRDKEAIGIGAMLPNEWRSEMGMPELPQSSALRVGDVNAALQVTGMMGMGQISTDQAFGLLTAVVGLTEDQARAVIADGPPPMPELPAPTDAADETRAAIARAIEGAALSRGTVEWDSAEHRRILERAEQRQGPHVRVFGDATRRVMERQQASILAKLAEIDKRAAGAPDGQRKAPTMDDLRGVFNMARWVVETRTAVRSIYRGAARDAGRAALDSVGAAIGWTGDNKPTVNALARRSQRFAQSINETTWDDLKRELANGIELGFGVEGKGGLADIVRGVMGSRIRSSGETIARTEIHGTFETAGRLAIKNAADELGLRYLKEWVSALDDRVRDDHADAHGQTVGIDEEFEVGGARGMAPGEMGEADQDINCRCTSKYIVDRS